MSKFWPLSKITAAIVNDVIVDDVIADDVKFEKLKLNPTPNFLFSRKSSFFCLSIYLCYLS